jgi:leucyl aminopeptidase
MKITTVDQKLDKVRADALVVFLFQGEKLTGEVQRLDKAVSSSISETIRLGDFKGKMHEVTSIYTHGKVPSSRVFLVGVGKKADFEPRIARNIAGSAARGAVKLGVKKLAVCLRNEVNAEEVIEGVELANYDPGLYKTKKETSEIAEITIIGAVNKQTIKHSQVVSEATNWVRKLISEPPNVMTPKRMVEEARKLARNYKFGIEVIDEQEAERKGMGAFVGVAKGSDEPSYMVVLKYRGGGRQTLGVVGKGITFDTGGLSLKPSSKLTDMKMDMAGAAACFGAMRVVGELKPRVNVVMVCPITENMPSGKALKPDDVITSLNGKTIEITNTDAEGRVVLADALVYAQKLGATKLADLATLTGAVLVIFGNEAAAVMGSPQSWVDQVLESSEEAGERVWQLPMYEEYETVLKSEIADVANAYKGLPSAGTSAGTIAGGIFLQEFVKDETNWVHLDIAGTAWIESEKPFITKGPTGFGVRTLVKLIEGLGKAK